MSERRRPIEFAPANATQPDPPVGGLKPVERPAERSDIAARLREIPDYGDSPMTDAERCLIHQAADLLAADAAPELCGECGGKQDDPQPDPVYGEPCTDPFHDNPTNPEAPTERSEIAVRLREMAFRMDREAASEGRPQPSDARFLHSLADREEKRG